MKILLGSALVCLLVSSARVQAVSPGDVSFYTTNFTMKCPEEGIWYKGLEKLSEDEMQEYTQEYKDDSEGYYYCSYGEDTKYHFYVRGKVCPDCYELDSLPVAVAIVLDILLTLGVILVVYMLVQRRTAAKPTPKKGSSSGPSGGPSSTRSEYEPLRHNNRSDVYSGVHRTG